MKAFLARKHRGELADLSMSVITTIVLLFVGLFMIAKVSAVSAINNTSDFYTVYTGLTTSVGTIFDVLILTAIIVCLGVAIGVLRGFGAVTGSGQMSV